MIKKNILIYVNDGFAIRYLLRSDIYKNLISSNCNIIIVSHNSDEEYFKKKFSAHNVTLESCRVQEYERYRSKNKLQRILRIFRSFILNGNYDTQTVDDFREIYVYQQGWIIKNGYLKYSIGLLWQALSKVFMKFKFLRSMLLKFEYIFYTPKIHSDLFQKYEPDLVVVTALCGFEYNEFFAREALKNKCKICTIILSWDNTSGIGYPGYVPNFVVSWTNQMKKELIELNDVDPKKIFVGGIAHFDHYFNSDVISKNELFSQLNLDLNKKTIFYATKSPRRFPWGPDIVKFIAESIKTKKIYSNAQLLVRIHPLHYRKSKNKDFSDILKKYDDIENEYENVIINRPKISSRKINFDMEDDEMSITAAILTHSDLMINMFSTMIIEASIFNLPSINICLKNEFRGNEIKTKQDIMVEHRQTHSKRVYETGGVRNIYTYDQFIECINEFLNDKKIDAEKRLKIVDNEVGEFRGNSGDNISRILINLAN
tara:strand:+ start:411 stop:1868 length:1458 start_codon:yes stop_codon:yes gene_type:complete